MACGTYDKASDHREASGLSTPLLVSMETRTGAQELRLDHYKDERKGVLLLAFDRLQS